MFKDIDYFINLSCCDHICSINITRKYIDTYVMIYIFILISYLILQKLKA